jgi:hypothetical protein
MSEAARERAAFQAALWMVPAGERPLYIVRAAHDGRWHVEGRPWLAIDANDRRLALRATRTVVAEWLGVDPDAFDVVSD